MKRHKMHMSAKSKEFDLEGNSARQGYSRYLSVAQHDKNTGRFNQKRKY